MVRKLVKPEPRAATRDDGYTAGYYDYKTGEVCLAFWDDTRKVVERQPFRSYFLLTEKDYAQVRCRDLDARLDDVKATKDGHVKLYTTGTRDELRNLVDWIRTRGAEPLEADLPPLNRFLTDHQIKFSENPRILFFDLETDARLGWSRREDHRILSVSYWSESAAPGDTIVAESDDDAGELDLLTRFAEVIAGHDILVAWNGDEYDEPVIKSRYRHHRLWPEWRLVTFLDFMQVFKHPYFGYGRDTEGTGVKLTFGLDKVGEALLGMPKMDIVKEMQQRHGMLTNNPGHAIYHAWMQDKLLLKQYNHRDVAIMVRLERKYGYIDGLATLSHICNRFLSSFCIRTGYLNDAYILRQGARTGVHFPTKFHFYGSENPFVDTEQIEGAYVKEPVPGFYREVCCLDFASLYPNVIRTFNISPETYVCMDHEFEQATGDYPSNHRMCTAGNGAMFRTDKEGVFPAMVSETMGRRAQFKRLAHQLEEALQEGTLEHRRAKQRSDANKVISNSGYGIMSSPVHRYYSRECGEAVTVTGKQIIQLVIEEAEKRGIQVLYGDTDSVYLRCSKRRALEFSAEMAAVIDEWVQARAGEPWFIRLELDAVYDRIVFVKKKRYAGRKVGSEHGHADVKGLEFVRTDGCAMTRAFQKEVIDYLLWDDSPDVEGARKIVERWRDRLFGGNATVEELTITQSVQKDPSEYAQKTTQVRIAEKMLADGREVYPGMKVSYILTGTSGDKSTRKEGVHVDDFDGKYDAGLYWKDKVFPASQRVLEAAFPELPWKAMLKYRLEDEKQQDMGLFVDAVKKYSDVVLNIDISKLDADSAFQAIEKVADKYPGQHPLTLELVNGDAWVTQLNTDKKVARVPGLITEVEKIVRGRCYYGPEEWDDDQEVS